MEGRFSEERRNDGSIQMLPRRKDAFFQQDFAYFSTRTSACTFIR